MNLFGMQSLPPVVKNLLILNVIAFVLSIVLESFYRIDISDILGLHYISSNAFKPVQFVSYMFLHADIGHIFFNMFALWMFGSVLENFWGPKRFFTFYIVTGIGAGIIQMLVAYFRLQMLGLESIPDVIFTEGLQIIQNNQNYLDPTLGEVNAIINASTIGASGAVFGLLMAFGMLFPNAPMYIMFIPVPIKAKWLVLGYGLFELFSGVRNEAGDNVAHFAHLGGMVFGYILIVYWRHKGTYGK